MFEEIDGTTMLSEDQVDALFGDGTVEDPQDGGSQDPPKQEPDSDPSNQPPAEEKPEEVDPENLFDEEDVDPENPESVGRKEGIQGKKEDAPSDKSAPPYSSLAKALKEEGILLNLEDSELENVKTSEDFVSLMEKTIQAKFDERQKRIDEALNNGVELSVVQQFEQTIKQLNSITDEQVKAETPEGENLRKQILYRDYLNKGFSEERAKRAIKQAFTDGTDVDDAQDALESIKATVQEQYQAKLDEAKAEEEAVKKQQTEQAKALRKGLLEDKELFGDLEVDKATRQKALDALIKPVYQDPDTGKQYTAIQLYEKENRVDFLKKIGLVFALTDGLKSLDGLVGKKVKKEVGKGMKALEDALNNTQRKSDGSLNYVSSANDKESFLGFTLDV